jgi:hypothetical protein
VRGGSDAERVLATIVFTDIVQLLAKLFISRGSAFAKERFSTRRRGSWSATW